MAAFSSIIAAVGAAAAAGSAVNQYQQGKKAAANADRMAEEAKTAAANAKLESAKAETDAATRVNSKLAARNRAVKASSLLAKDSMDSTSSDVSVLGGGKTTLGQ